jgi:hypothetical protein
LIELSQSAPVTLRTSLGSDLVVDVPWNATSGGMFVVGGREMLVLNPKASILFLRGNVSSSLWDSSTAAAVNGSVSIVGSVRSLRVLASDSLVVADVVSANASGVYVAGAAALTAMTSGLVTTSHVQAATAVAAPAFFPANVSAMHGSCLILTASAQRGVRAVLDGTDNSTFVVGTASDSVLTVWGESNGSVQVGDSGFPSSLAVFGSSSFLGAVSFGGAHSIFLGTVRSPSRPIRKR